MRGKRDSKYEGYPISWRNKRRVRIGKAHTIAAAIERSSQWPVSRALEAIEKSPIWKACLIGAAAFGAWQVWDEITVRREERATRQDEAIARAWQILTTVAPGNTGKADAIGVLHKADILLEGIDISCEKMGGGWDPKQLHCERPTIVGRVELASESYMQNVWEKRSKDASAPSKYHDGGGTWVPNEAGAKQLYDNKYRGSCIGKEVGVKISGQKYFLDNRDDSISYQFGSRNLPRYAGISFRNANLSGVVFANTIMPYADFEGADLRGARFIGVIAEGVNFTGANMDGVVIQSSYMPGAWIALPEARSYCGAFDYETWDNSKTGLPNDCDRRDGENYSRNISMNKGLLIDGSYFDGSIINIINSKQFTGSVDISDSTMMNSEIAYAGFGSSNMTIKSSDLSCSVLAISGNDSMAHMNLNHVSMTRAGIYKTGPDKSNRQSQPAKLGLAWWWSGGEPTGSNLFADRFECGGPYERDTFLQMEPGRFPAVKDCKRR